MQATGAELIVEPVTSLPPALAVGRGTALFVDGRCSHPAGPIEELWVGDGERRHAALGWGLAPPRMRGDDYWWAIVPIESIGSERELTLQLGARGPGEVEAGARLGTIRLLPELPPTTPDPPPLPADAAEEAGGEKEPLVAICMATYEPDPAMLERQLDSIRAQSHRRWVCLISDDGSRPQTLSAMRGVIGGDRRFALSAASRNRGFYANFERALGMVPPEATYVALADQDDRWHDDKLARLLAGLRPGSRLVYSDMRITDREGGVLYDTYWSFRRNNHTDFASLVLANTVTGAASLFDAGLLDDVLPFPPRHGNAFHDHWIAQVAMALGDISYVDEPLQDYVQHDDAALGHLQANGYGRYSAPLRERIGIWYGRWSGRGYRLGWRVPYFRLYCRVKLATTVLRMRCQERIDPAKLAALEAIEDSPAGLLWLLRRALRDIGGPTETIGRERVMLAGLAWRRAAIARKRARARLRGR